MNAADEKNKDVFNSPPPPTYLQPPPPPTHTLTGEEAYCSTPDPGHCMGKWQKKQENITYKNAKRSALSQQMTTRQQETDITVWQRQTQIKKILIRNTTLEQLVSN